MSVPELVMNCLAPLTTHSPFSSSALVRVLPASDPASGSVRPKPVRLGRTAENGIAPSVYGLIELGVERRPEIAAALTGRAVFRFEEDFAPVRVAFKPRSVVVEDGDLRQPDLVIAGRLPDIVH